MKIPGRGATKTSCQPFNEMNIARIELTLCLVHPDMMAHPRPRFILSRVAVVCLLFLVQGIASSSAQDTPAAPAAPGSVAEEARPAPRERRPVVWNNADGKERPGITHHVLASRAMERDVGYNVYLPPGYADHQLHYPVLYFLHGMGGNENSDGPGFCRYVARLIAAGEVPPVICVFPNGGASGYRDHPEEKIMVETMLIQELIPHIDATLRTRPDRDSRMIAGYSMGSGGSARLALKYPELFCTTGGWGLSFTGRNTEAPLAPEFQPDALKRTPLRVRILMIIGLEDPGLAGYGPAVKALTDAKYPFTYRTLENVGHNLGRYYELTGEDMVRFLMEGIAPPSP